MIRLQRQREVDAAFGRYRSRGSSQLLALVKISFSFEWIENAHSEMADVEGIACHKSHPMHFGGRREKTIDHR